MPCFESKSLAPSSSPRTSTCSCQSVVSGRFVSCFSPPSLSPPHFCVVSAISLSPPLCFSSTPLPCKSASWRLPPTPLRFVTTIQRETILLAFSSVLGLSSTLPCNSLPCPPVRISVAKAFVLMGSATDKLPRKRETRKPAKPGSSLCAPDGRHEVLSLSPIAFHYPPRPSSFPSRIARRLSSSLLGKCYKNNRPRLPLRDTSASIPSSSPVSSVS